MYFIGLFDSWLALHSRDILPQMANNQAKYFATILAYQLILLTLLFVTCYFFGSFFEKLGFYCLFVAIHTLITFAVFGYDKKRAEKEEWRVPERVLHSLSAFFGLLGALIGMWFWKHKSSKKSFVCLTAIMSMFSIALYLLLALIIFFWLF